MIVGLEVSLPLPQFKLSVGLTDWVLGFMVVLSLCYTQKVRGSVPLRSTVLDRLLGKVPITRRHEVPLGPPDTESV